MQLKQKMIHLNKNQSTDKRLPNMTIDTSKPYQHKQIDTRWVELKLNHKLPPRAYFGSCIQAGKVFIHGGYNQEKGILSDMYEAQFYNLPTEWIQIKPKNKKNKSPPALRNHTLCAYTAYLILFGGQKNMLQNNHDIYRYDMRTNEWDILKSSFVQSSSKISLSLDSHIAHIYNDHMYVFGGYQSQKGLYFNHLLLINLKNVAQGQVQIKLIQVNAKPSPRGNMSSTIIDNQIFLFGGTNSDQIFDDLWSFNFEKLEWKQVPKPSNQQSLEWPQKRKGQTMSAHAKSRSIFMFGGIKQITKQQNDIMVFLVSKMKWVRIHKNTNELYEPSPTIKKQIETSPSIIDARDRKLNSNSKSKSKTKTQPKSPFKLGIKSVTCYNKSMTQATEIQTSFNATHKPLKRQLTSLMPYQKKRIISVIQQKKNREFLLRKKKLLSAIEKSPSTIPRSHSPTSQSIQYSIDTIGQQKISSSKQDNLPKVIFDPQIGQLIGKKPCARDGHAALVYQDGILIVGGDRHMMAFGDVFRFRMDKAIQNIHLYQ